MCLALYGRAEEWRSDGAEEEEVRSQGQYQGQGQSSSSASRSARRPLGSLSSRSSFRPPCAMLLFSIYHI